MDDTMDDELEGEFIGGWPNKKRLRHMQSTDAEGRAVYGQSPILDQEGLITPVDAFYFMAQIAMPEPVHPDDWSFEIAGDVKRPFTYTLEDIKKLPARTVRAVTECAGNDADFFEYQENRLNEKPVIRRANENIEAWFAKRGGKVEMKHGSTFDGVAQMLIRVSFQPYLSNQSVTSLP